MKVLLLNVPPLAISMLPFRKKKLPAVVAD